MKSFHHTNSIWLPQPLDQLFPFFAEARNLERITPRWLQFSVLTPEPIPMAEGTLIDYRLRFRGIPMRWRSEIAAWEPPLYFVDRKVRGPFREWHHEHLFAEVDGGTAVTDRVRDAVPFGRLANWLVVRRDVEAIFDYRNKRLAEIFGIPNHVIDAAIVLTS